MIRFIIPGAPQGKGRPRHTKAGRTYTPPETRAYEDLIRACAAQAVQGTTSPGTLWQVSIWALTARPKTRPEGVSSEVWKSGRQVLRRGKPDVDNIAKAVLDGCTGVIWGDDTQVVRVVVERLMAAEGQEAGVMVAAQEVSG